MSYNHEWYYFGDLVTLVAAGADTCSGLALIDDGELVDVLHSMCPDQPNLKKIMEGGKQNDEPIIFDIVRNLKSIVKYPLSKKLQVDLKICEMPDRRPQVLVGLDMIILPWPFTVDAKKRGSKLKKCIDFHRDDLPDNLLKIDPWMHTVEELLYDPDGKDYLDEFKKSKNHRNVIIEYAWEKHRRELTAPNYFDVIPDTTKLSIETFIKQDDFPQKKLVLHVGVRNVKGVAADPDDPHTLFDKWPCGGF